MNNTSGDTSRFLKITVLLLTLAVTVAFVSMIRGFLLSLALAAIFAGLSHPLYRRVLALCRGRATLASTGTIAVLMVLVILPLLGLLEMVARQAYDLSQKLVPAVVDRVEHPEHLNLQFPDWVPFHEELQNPSPQIVSKIGEFASKAGGFLAGSVAKAAMGTVAFVLHLFVMLYAMFWFLKEGPVIRDKLKEFGPLPPATKDLLIEKGLSMSRATIKGTLVLGILQGTLGGLALAVAGIEGAIFWGVVMAVLSVIPAIGTALVWLPAAIYLIATGEIGAGVGLAVWCVAVVGTLDNIVRPRLVGGDTQMPDLIVMVSTLGGVSLFGAFGVILGPVLAVIFLTMWEVYAETFHNELAIPGGEEQLSETTASAS